MTGRAFTRSHDLDDMTNVSDETPSSPDSSDLHTAEMQARRALGLIPGGNGGQRERPSPPGAPAFRSDRFRQDGQRRRFVRDGEVPVVVMARSEAGATGSPSASTSPNCPTNRLAKAELALVTERRARERAERSFAEAQTKIRELQTKLGHLVLTRDEALASAQRALAQQHEAETALAAERAAREKAELELAGRLAARLAAEDQPDEAPAASPARRIARVAAAKIRVEQAPKAKPKTARAKRAPAEPKPVRWWIRPKDSRSGK
ncbi:conserved protein of unknown function [Rhodovastum atsumiense]|uniref:hypothetical protein n=1 Tax=Rhodovastum atsumiense TaxID=504468 RepID=UPI002024FA61|nr:hypothetical protein [Rhodovastum atsumiense]CAH2601436.1 conserved protein of unknown function [Rhodovastum atsumiense]